MNSNSLVSIILPVYNGADFLAKSIQSCINQTYRNWELIIVNDCSKDDSYDIALSYAEKDKRIRVLNNKVNLKLPASLNRGFEEAKGEYYTWTSHDNKMHPQMLEKFVNYLENELDMGLVCCNYIAIDEKDNVLYTVDIPDPMLSMPLANSVCYGFMYRKEVALKVGKYDTNLFLIEDYDYWVRIWLNYKMSKLDDFLYYTRVHGNTLTLQRKQEIAQRLYELRLNYFESFNNALKDYPQEQFKYFNSILKYAEGKEKMKLTVRFIVLSPFNFGLKYIFNYVPKQIIKRTSLYEGLKKETV